LALPKQWHEGKEMAGEIKAIDGFMIIPRALGAKQKNKHSTASYK